MEDNQETPRAPGNQIDWKRLIAAFTACGAVIAAALLFDGCG